MRNLLLIAIVFFNARSFATTITIFSEGNGQCRYVLSDDETKPIARWAGDCLENLTDSRRVDIAEGTTLWKALKELSPSLNLQNIKIIITKDASVITKLKSLSIPVIELDKNEMAKSIKVNNGTDASVEKKEAQDYNSSRSNKANSTASVNKSDTSDAKKINSIATAQDYNSSRSNKANSITPAQDYNSSRSNKANSIATVNNSDTSTGDKTNSIATAQDYNSSRSNKANSVAPAQDYNSSRSNKANSIATVNNSDTSDSDKANSITTAQDYNSSRSNKANSIAPVQDYISSRSNKAGIILSAGIALTGKNSYMKNGFVFDAGYYIPLKNSVGIEVGVGFWSNGFTYSPSSFFPKEYKNEMEKSINNSKWINTTISAGPSVIIGKGKCNATMYAKAALLFTKIPSQKIGGDNPMAVFGGNQTSFALNPGMRLNYLMNSNLSLFINGGLVTSLKKNVPYTEKDISKATNADGSFNADAYLSLPLEKKYVGVNLFGLSAGVKINL